MPTEDPKSYHHGNVRSALIGAAVAALKTQPPEAVSMRKLAQEIGVSHNAPYMHFTDKEALWLAVSDIGFARLSDCIEEANRARTGGKERMIAGCAAYLRFAEENREYMLVMFRTAPPGVDRRLSPKGTEALGSLVREIGAAMAAGHLRAGDPQRLALLVWAMLHGMTMSRLQFGADQDPMNALPVENRVQWMLDQVLPW